MFNYYYYYYYYYHYYYYLKNKCFNVKYFFLFQIQYLSLNTVHTDIQKPHLGVKCLLWLAGSFFYILIPCSFTISGNIVHVEIFQQFILYDVYFYNCEQSLNLSWMSWEFKMRVNMMYLYLKHLDLSLRTLPFHVVYKI